MFDLKGHPQATAVDDTKATYRPPLKALGSQPIIGQLVGDQTAFQGSNNPGKLVVTI
jgi:hypothetical protein